MRVGIDIRPLTAAPFSGIGRQTLALYDTLRHRPDTECVPFTSGPLTHVHRGWACCPTTACDIARLWHPLERDRFERRFLPSAIYSLALDVYIATANSGLPFGLTDLQRKRTKWVLQVHDLFALTMPRRHGHHWRRAVVAALDRMRIRHSIRLADAIWVPSEFTARTIAETIPEARKRIHVLHDAVPFEPWQRLQQPVYAPERYWLLVGSGHARKNVPWFVSAWHRARRQWPELIPPLVIIGQGEDVGPLPEPVRFVQGINDAQLGAWYRGAERLWQPSLAEGFGLPVIEAAACGTPVATALGSALDETTPPGAPRFDPRNADALVDLMQALAQARHHPTETEATLQGWARRYDLPHYAARVDALISQFA